MFRINKKQEQKENGVGERVVPIDTHFVLRMGLMDNLSLYFKVVKSPECKACLPHHTVALHVYIPHIQILLRDIYTSIMLTNSFFFTSSSTSEVQPFRVVPCTYLFLCFSSRCTSGVALCNCDARDITPVPFYKDAEETIPFFCMM